MPDGLLSQEHEAALAAAKQKLREENEEYIRQHPELRGAIRLLMAKLLDDTPDDLQQYVCEFFTDPDLERKVEEFRRCKRRVTVAFLKQQPAVGARHPSVRFSSAFGPPQDARAVARRARVAGGRSTTRRPPTTTSLHRHRRRLRAVLRSTARRRSRR